MKRLREWLLKRSRMSCFLMLIVGGYLFYAVYGMLGGLSELRSSPIPVYIFAALFVLIGLLMCLLGAYALIKGLYSEKSTDGHENDDGSDDSDGSDVGK